MPEANSLGDLFSANSARHINLLPKFSAKRQFDFAFGVVLLLMLLPVLALVALMVKRDGGPAIFGHTRIGLNGRPFKCWKFRSMMPNAEVVLNDMLAKDEAMREEWLATRKLRQDPRITPIGQFLRRTSLDELPQIFNVLQGNMSFVGPRPVVQQELDDFYGNEGLAAYRLARPGITGLWQVSGRSDTDYPTRVGLDMQYVRQQSFWGDMGILMKTVVTVVAGRGAR